VVHGARVVIADAQPLIRAGLRSVIEPAGMVVVGGAARTDDLVDLYCATGADLCVADSGLPGDLLEAVRRLAAAGGKAVVLADHDDEHLMPCLVRAGARGYVSKSSSPDSLIRAFHAVMAGEVAIPRELVSRLLLDLQQVENRRLTDPGVAQLTGRERQVLDMHDRGHVGPPSRWWCWGRRACRYSQAQVPIRQ
jgi:DNA-binding NarL/FixJ family response regulator